MIYHQADVFNYKFLNGYGLEDLGEVSYKEAHEMIFFQITSNLPHGASRKNAHETDLALDDEFFSSIDVKFEQVNVDMKNSDPKKKVEYKTYEAKPCTQKDF